MDELVSDCAIHETVEKFNDDSFMVCFECGHVFHTEKELIEADHEMRRQYMGPNVEKAPSSSVIFSCPHCTHDF